MRWSLIDEVVTMAWNTLRTNRLRSGLTILGIVIGITSIVGMTSLVSGFDRSMRSQIEALGPDTMIIAQLSGISMVSGVGIRELMMRPVITPEDAAAIKEGAPSVAIVDLTIGQGDPSTQRAVRYRNEQSKTLQVFGASDRWSEAMRLPMAHGRFFTAGEVERRQRVVVLGQTAYAALFPTEDPIGKYVRIDRERYLVVGVAEPQPSPGGMNLNQDDFVVIPVSAYERHFGIRPMRMGPGEIGTLFLIAVPREGLREQARTEVENIMRIRHGLRLDEPNDFDLLNQDAILDTWAQITQATFLALIVLSSIALMVGGIGVMSIMTISVTERTREIGVRKALGARRVEVLWQFLFEAVFLTTAGGILGILCGSGIGLLVHQLTGFPVSLPWWSFAIGVGFSAGVGVFFGMVPAIRASRLDPIEALRHE